MNKATQQALLAATQGIHQRVVFGDEARKQLFEGASILAKAVASTMGPSGHNVTIDATIGAPLITKDGVTVARSINLKDRLQSMGAELIKEVASKTNDIAGDGTTTATVLAHAMFKEGIKMISSGRDSVQVKRGMDLATEEVLKALKQLATPVRSKTDIVNVGTISANGDVNIGELLAEAIEKVGEDGIITVEPGKSTSTILEVVEGLQFDGGYLSPYFVTNSEKNTVELENPLVLATNRKISSLDELFPILEKIANADRSLLIIADDVEGPALQTLIVNRLKGNLMCCAVKAPSYGDNRTDILGDIACVVGGTVLDASSPLQLKNLELEHLGLAAKVVVTRTSTTIVGSPDPELKEKVEERVRTLRAALAQDGTLDDLRIDRYRKRLAKLAGGVAVVKVGGSTETEILERKDRVEDAHNATIAAVKEGIVPGGGCALFYAAKIAEKELKKVHEQRGDVGAGIDVILNACRSPLFTIVSNTGKSPEVVANQLETAMNTYNAEVTSPGGELSDFQKDFFPGLGKLHFGYNAATCKFQDLVAGGIIDPVKVTRCALEHASSVVGLMLTCDSVILNEKEAPMSGDEE